MTSNGAEHVSAARIAYWYFRLNGFLGVENFVLHPDDKREPQKTEADLCGVRFQYHSELDMTDDIWFSHGHGSALFVIAEITRGVCKLNGPWTDPSKMNMQYVLRAIGAFPPDEHEALARSLYTHCTYPEPKTGEGPIVQLIAVGKTVNEDLREKFPNLLQIELAHMLGFMYRRFDAYRGQKANHHQWDRFGQALWKESGKDAEPTFVKKMIEQV
jgi:hypothetical protein